MNASLSKRLATIPSRHPRLHFDGDGREGLIRLSESSHRLYAEWLFDWVDRYRDWSPQTEIPARAGSEVMLEESGAFVTNAALAYVISGERQHLHLARRWALAMTEVPKTELRRYGLGIYAAGLARAYDWLYDEFTDEERQKIREHLARLVLEVYHGSIPGHERQQWWADATMHHDHWIPVGGYGEAALALLGEVDEASTWAAAAKEDFDVCLSWLGEDGAWHEGAADWCYTLAPLLWFYGAWQSVVGDDFHDFPWLRNTAAYRLYHWLPDGTYVYLNDSFRSGRYNTSGMASCHLQRRLASLFQDGHAQWLADRDESIDRQPAPKGVYQAPYESYSFMTERTNYPHPDSQCVAWNVLWFDPEVKPESPDDLSVGRHFSNAGLAIMRSGWDSQATVVSLACGPPGGERCAARIRAGETCSIASYDHAHADFNAFTLFARGQYFITPAGYARRSSRFQNVVTVNGADFPPDAAAEARIVAFGRDDANGFSYAVGDATDAFASHLEVDFYRRHLILLDSGVCVLFDELRLASKGFQCWNRFEWTVHSDPQVHRVEAHGPHLLWRPVEGEEPRLDLHIVEPLEFAWEHATLKSTGGTDMLAAHRLVRPEWYSDRMHVLAVMYPNGDHQPPDVLRHPDFLAVAAEDQALIGFALSPLSPESLTELTQEDTHGRDLLIFGSDPDSPETYLVKTDTEARKESLGRD